MLGVGGDVDATVAAIEGAVGALALRAGALGAAAAGGFAIAAVSAIGVGVEATTRALLVELRVEQVRVADALAHLAQRVDTTLRVAAAAGVFVPFDVDAAATAVERARRALAGAVDAAAAAAAVAVRAAIA